MSWYFSACGKASLVAQKARADLERHRCVEPEETIKAGVIGILEAALLVYPEDRAVRVEASGSQYTPSAGSGPINSLSLKIEEVALLVEVSP